MALPEFEILSGEYVRCPERHYPAWLAQGAARALPFAVPCVTRYAEARRAYTDRESFSSDAIWTFFDHVNGTRGGPLGIPLVSLDEPDHSRLRGILRPVFEDFKSKAFEAQLRTNARRILGRVALKSEVEATCEIIAPYIFEAMFHFFGIEREVPVQQLAIWSEAIRAPFPLIPPEQRRAAIAAQTETALFLDECLRSPPERRNCVMQIVREAINKGRCSEEEGLSLCRFLFYAGNQTTRLSLASILKILAERPAEQEILRAAPGQLHGFVHECLRIEPATQISLRSARREVTIAGQTLSPGDFLFIHNGSANRDPDMFDRPEEFDLTRANRLAHLTFGHGFHRCLGLEIAMKEMTCLLEELLMMTRSISLADEDPFEYQPKMFLRGPEYLRLTIDWR